MLELLLNRNLNIAAMGEIDLLALQIFRGQHTRWIGECSCRTRPIDCPIWGKLIEALRSGHDVDLINDPFSWPFGNTRLEEEYGWSLPYDMLLHKFHIATRLYAGGWPFTGTYAKWVEHRDFIYRKIAELHGVSAVVDASKDPLQMIDLVRFSRFPVKVLYLTRDVRGLAWSAVKRDRSTAIMEARNWTRVNARILSLLRRLERTDWIQVRYEDLCSDTEAELNRIHVFLGLSRRTVSAAKEKERRHTIAGNRTRFLSLETIYEDLLWQNNLTGEQLFRIRRIAGNVAASLGYDLSK